MVSSICFLLWYYALSRVNSTKVSVSLLFVPVFALLFGWLQLDEALTVGLIIGVILIKVGVILVTVEKEEN
ncbi:EamA family transporter [Caldalkalibacillus uzonensis]|uniref:EamA family transporter n=1 Tax=Caldalkalibacillus uzonensis TaxID=353224 RepID=UPI00352209A4